MIKRTIEAEIAGQLGDQKAIIIKGARQVGKTTLIQQLLEGKDNVLWVNGDRSADRNRWNDIQPDQLRFLLEGKRYVVIDEAQRIENIGLAIKMIIDEEMGVQPILSGSSSLDLASRLNEPLTGRKWTYELYPFTWNELRGHYGNAEALDQLSQRLITGSYPEVVTAKEKLVARLEEIASSYLYRDIIDHGLIRKPELLESLLKALAYQVGHEVSYNELANGLRISMETVRRYVRLLEESFVVFRLPPLSTNPRKEINTSRKIYFVDNGIRNAVINNFDPLHLRNDQGALWENYVVSEFKKRKAHAGRREKLYFWRSKGGAEVDLVTQNGGTIEAYEIKYNPKKKVRFPASFIERYQPGTTEVVNLENFYGVLE